MRKILGVWELIAGKVRSSPVLWEASCRDHRPPGKACLASFAGRFNLEIIRACVDELYRAARRQLEIMLQVWRLTSGYLGKVVPAPQIDSVLRKRLSNERGRVRRAIGAALEFEAALRIRRQAVPIAAL